MQLRNRRNCGGLLSVLLMLVAASQVACSNEEPPVSFDSTAVSTQNDLFTIVGKVNIRMDELDLENTRIVVDDGQYVGFLKGDGTFTIPGVPSNSYVVEISSPRNFYEPVRVDITSKGKVRSRRLNLVQPSDITLLRYPLNFESRGLPSYFFKREQFRIMDILLSPMVLMMIVPLLLVAVLPKIVNQDPELKREFEQTSNMFQPNANMPSISEMVNNYMNPKSNNPSNKKSASRPSNRASELSPGGSSASRRK